MVFRSWKQWACLALLLSIAFARLPANSLAVKFVDVTARAGIKFVHNNGGFGKKYLPETMGSGCAFLDYDNDGWQDILLLNSMDWPGHKRRRSTMALYRNNRGYFTDVTKQAGLDVELYGMGVAAGDYDNDGWVDIYVSCLGPDKLFRNTGKGRFVDVTAQAGLGCPDFGSSCAFLDYDRDGDLDLFVANYVEWSIEKDIFCTLDGQNKSYCTPESYRGVSSRLYANQGNGKFIDVTKRAGIYDATSKALGVAILDYNLDGWPDILVANDTQPNKLYHNNGNGTFSEKGVMAGIAFSEDGVARAGMGIDWGDYDGSGYPSVVIGNFSNEMLGLYHNEGNGLFIDEAPASTVGRSSLLTLAFGCFFFDFNLDGLLDILVANGHVENEINRVQPRVTYAQPLHLFMNKGRRIFEEVTAGAGLARPFVARGAAWGDYDNDGDPDILITTNNGPAYLFRNDGGNSNNFLKIRAVGTKSNRSGIGTVIRLKSGETKQWTMIRSGSSYLSQSELAALFGLGRSGTASIEVVWPSGRVERFDKVKANQYLIAKEGEGLAPAR